MPDNNINRLNELNKLLFKLNQPKKGDIVKFKMRGHDEIYDGEITVMQRYGNQIRYQIVAKGSAPPGEMRDIVIVECNGVRFQEIESLDDTKNFKPI